MKNKSQVKEGINIELTGDDAALAQMLRLAGIVGATQVQTPTVDPQSTSFTTDQSIDTVMDPGMDPSMDMGMASDDMTGLEFGGDHDPAGMMGDELSQDIGPELDPEMELGSDSYSDAYSDDLAVEPELDMDSDLNMDHDLTVEPYEYEFHDDEPTDEYELEIPDEELMDSDLTPAKTFGVDDLINSGNDMHKKKGTYPKVAGGDNPMQAADSLMAALRSEFRESLDAASRKSRGPVLGERVNFLVGKDNAFTGVVVQSHDSYVVVDLPETAHSFQVDQMMPLSEGLTNLSIIDSSGDYSLAKENGAYSIYMNDAEKGETPVHRKVSSLAKVTDPNRKSDDVAKQEFKQWVKDAPVVKKELKTVGENSINYLTIDKKSLALGKMRVSETIFASNIWNVILEAPPVKKLKKPKSKA